MYWAAGLLCFLLLGGCKSPGKTAVAKSHAADNNFCCVSGERNNDRVRLSAQSSLQALGPDACLKFCNSERRSTDFYRHSCEGLTDQAENMQNEGTVYCW